jgi:stage III sporulation protein SpoIIIAA
LQLLLDVLPSTIQQALIAQYTEQLNDLIEIVLDLGRVPEARFSASPLRTNNPFSAPKPGQLNIQTVQLRNDQVTEADISHVVKQVGLFTSDNRAGLPRTLHRISAMRNRQGDIVGLTCRVGKAITGTIQPIRDLVESGKSILLLGRPGVGKTTKLREIAKLLADQSQRRVLIVDTSNEIAGDGDIPHPGVGHARRMQVPNPEQQKAIMIEAVQNHTPEVIVVDEIGSEDEALAARTIAERGVILIATAHGSTLESVIKNPMLSDLVGGIQTVTLGDDEAKRRATQKTVLEREKKPTFDIVIEIRDRNTLAVYPDVAEAVDHLLRGWSLFPEVRKIDSDTGAIQVLQPTKMPRRQASDTASTRVTSASTEGVPQAPRPMRRSNDVTKDYGWEAPQLSPDFQPQAGQAVSAAIVASSSVYTPPNLPKRSDTQQSLPHEQRGPRLPQAGNNNGVGSVAPGVHTAASLMPVIQLSERDTAPLPAGTQEFRIFLYGIAKGFVDRVLERLNMHHVRVTKNIHDAHSVLVLRGNARPGSKILQLAEDYQVPVFFAKTNTMPQIQRVVREALETVSGVTIPSMPDHHSPEDGVTQPPHRQESQMARPQSTFPDLEDENELALSEAKDAIQSVLNEGISIELTPRRSYIRRLQHELADQSNLISFSIGDEPNRRLKLVPTKNKPVVD